MSDNKRQQLLREWVTALESGEYKQGKSRLQDGDSYCCLGVACLIAEKHGIPVVRTDKGVLSGQDLDGQYDVRVAFSLTCAGEYGRGSDTLAMDNDSGATFAEIAATIRKEFIHE